MTIEITINSVMTNCEKCKLRQVLFVRKCLIPTNFILWYIWRSVAVTNIACCGSFLFKSDNDNNCTKWNYSLIIITKLQLNYSIIYHHSMESTGSNLAWIALKLKYPDSEIISMAKCKTAVTPLLTHWSYCSLALSHRFVDLWNVKRTVPFQWMAK